MISRDAIASRLDTCLAKACFAEWAVRYEYQQGKVRDMYRLPASKRMPARRVLVATDRQSAHDHMVGTIPFRGQVLNQMALWWFSHTGDIVPNAALANPDPNAVVMEDLDMFPVEIVVRAYLTGSTSTSIWTHYAAGAREFCGHQLPDGMAKNTLLPQGAIITPSTKAADGHDESISIRQVLERGLVDPNTWDQLSRMAFALFARGRELAAERGLILVDTKYEFGETPDGLIMIADEIHTPDSSRYWLLDSYQDRFDRGEEPEALDKEPLRIWLQEQGISDTHVPKLTDGVRVHAAERYIALYERMTGEEFVPADSNVPVRARIRKAIAPFFH